MLLSPLWCITLPLIIAGLPETQFEATLTYSDGERTVTIRWLARSAAATRRCCR